MGESMFTYEVKCPICGDAELYTGVGGGSRNFYATHYYKHMLEAGAPPALTAPKEANNNE